MTESRGWTGDQPPAFLFQTNETLIQGRGGNPPAFSLSKNNGTPEKEKGNDHRHEGRGREKREE
jgi:hypothetical protein